MARLPELPAHACAYFDCAKRVSGSPKFCDMHYGVLRRKISNARHNRQRYLSEGETRRRVIDPLLTALGWEKRPNVWVDEVPTKSPAPGAKRPTHPADYMLYAPRTPSGQPRPHLIIEAKKTRADLTSEHEGQLLKYMERTRVRLGAVTNGCEWRFFELKANQLNPMCQTRQDETNQAMATTLISNLARPKPMR